VRKVKTASGATAVQIARKHRGVRTIVEHIGSAHDDTQLAVLVQIAKERIMAGQLAFDLDALTPTAPTGVAPIVTGSRARVLWEVLEAAYSRLGFTAAVDDETFKKLVLARVIEPTSKADTIRVLGELGLPAPGLRTIWRTLARCVAQDWRGRLAAAAYAHATRDGQLKLVLYDVTTLYFEAEREDKLRKVGMSKERRVDPQILVGLLVDQGGFPLEVHEFAGNRGETLTLLPVLDQFRERHSATEVVVVADAGMLSAANLNRLEDAGFGFIVGSRTSSAPYDLAEHYATVGNIVTDGETVETTRTMGAGVNARERRVVWQYSHKRKIRDNITLNKQIERAEQIAAGTRPAKKDRFVTLGTGPGVNWARVEKAREYIGLKGYVTNLSTATASAAEIVAAYHDLFQVEATFRMAKTDLRARPMFHHEKDSIDAHLTIVFCALAISRHLQDRTGLSIKRIVRALRPLRDVVISVQGQQITATTPAEGEAAEILTALRPRVGH